VVSSRGAAPFSERLLSGLAQLRIELDSDAVERLHTYFLELKKWSGKVNLIAKGSGDEQIIENHFLDSLTLLPLLQGTAVHLLDVGSGAGFPGLVLKAARPTMKVTLVEPRLKRVSFLRHIARTLGLGEVNVLACRVEEEAMLPSDGDYTHITSRAVADIADFLAMVARFTRRDLQIICMKGPKWQEELAHAEKTVRNLSFLRQEAISRRLPFSGAERALLVFSRV